MRPMTFPRLLITVCAALTLVGCQQQTRFVRSILAPPVRSKPPSPPVFAMEAEAALARSDFAASASFAELAVRSAPSNPAPRSVLAQAYLSGGRLLSAQQAFGDLLELDPVDPKARLGRALARLAIGDRPGALDDLETLGTAVENPDVGLALALAGETSRGVALLTDAARADTATARVRQNLALALALDGQWARARVVAAQDLDPATVDERIRQWTALAANSDPAVRTASILAIRPRTDDTGRPVELALGKPTEDQKEVAEQPQPQPDVTASGSVQLDEPTPTDSPVPITVAVVPIKASIEPPVTGRWVVQLGAFASETVRDAAWTQVRTGKLAPLIGAYEPVNSMLVRSGGQPLHRLAFGHFSERSQAELLCRELKRAGADCLVREIRLANQTQLAARF